LVVSSGSTPDIIELEVKSGFIVDKETGDDIDLNTLKIYLPRMLDNTESGKKEIAALVETAD